MPPDRSIRKQTAYLNYGHGVGELDCRDHDRTVQSLHRKERHASGVLQRKHGDAQRVQPICVLRLCEESSSKVHRGLCFDFNRLFHDCSKHGRASHDDFAECREAIQNEVHPSQKTPLIGLQEVSSV
jgi:hypothetical protein